MLCFTASVFKRKRSQGQRAYDLPQIYGNGPEGTEEGFKASRFQSILMMMFAAQAFKAPSQCIQIKSLMVANQEAVYLSLRNVPVEHEAEEMMYSKVSTQ